MYLCRFSNCKLNKQNLICLVERVVLCIGIQMLLAHARERVFPTFCLRRMFKYLVIFRPKGICRELFRKFKYYYETYLKSTAFIESN